MVLGDLLTEDGPGPEEQFEKTDLRNAVHEVMGESPVSQGAACPQPPAGA